jgi:MFS family permease
MNAPPVSKRLTDFSRGLPPSYWFLWAGQLINRAGSFVLPMLTVYLTRVRGLSLVDAGPISSLYGLGSLVGTTLGGELADRVGRRATLLTSLVTGAGAMLLVSAAPTTAWLAAATLLLGVTGDMFRPASQAMVADLIPSEYRLKAFTYQYWAVNLGFTFAALLGGALAEHHFQALFFGDAGTSLAFAAIVFWFIPETKPASDPTAKARPALGEFLRPFVDLKYAVFLTITALITLVFFQHLVAMPADMAAKGLSTQAYGLAVAVNGVLIVLFQPLVVQWVARRAAANVLGLAAALTGAGFALNAWAASLGGYALAVAVWTAGELLFAPVNSSVVAELSPPDARGRYSGAFGLTWSLSMMVAPLVSPRLIEVVGMSRFWGLCGLAAGVAAVGHLTFTRRALRGASSGGAAR